MHVQSDGASARSGIGYVSCIGWLLLSASYPACAQNPEDRARDQADRIEREEAERQRQELLLQRRERDRPPRSTQPQAPVPAAPSGEGAACVQVDKVVVGGITVISPQTIARAVSRFEGRCVGLAELNLILESVTFLYVDAGYVASRAYLPPQDLSDGILDIVIVEGTLESIVIDGEPGNHPARIQTAFPGMKGRPVNLRDIEQGLDQLNRLSSIDARMELQAGTRPGGSVLHVFTSRSLPVHLSLGSPTPAATSSPAPT